MGIALWILCAAAVFFTIRNVRFLKPTGWLLELVTAILSALLLGGIATALDFGGWNDPDWRAALFILFGCAAISAVLRLCLSPHLRDSA
ncbi:MAG TPA: hypothetical protein VGQ46_06710 [Thermoanaerobaculia bacterium]|jgi:nicotinamide riboside transporter PnuC|nr:hypothetical protein [Thermoanaerobaculia bacterium]